MFLIESDSLFKPIHRPDAVAAAGDFLFVYDDKKIGLTLENALPLVGDVFSPTEKTYCFGHINNQQCLLWNPHDSSTLNFIETRFSHPGLAKELYQAALIGNHIAHWRASHRYCGKCAARMVDKIDEQALICPQCAYIAYPKISPCAIVLITRGEEMLLARSPHFRPGIMSALAGFVAVGESVEQTVAREVKEEVGIEVGQLKYICSQPWPFPDSLMLGFTAKYISGEIMIDNHEIEEAGWFHMNNLPPLPNKMSIARHLIEMHLHCMGKK